MTSANPTPSGDPCNAPRPEFETGPALGRDRLPCAREDVHLTKREIIALRELAAELVTATDQHVFWFGRVRDTALELQRTVDRWLAELPS